MELRTSIEIFKNLGIEYHKIIASGGGARGKLFLEMQADIFDCEIYTNQGNEQACIGAAITAAIAAGEFGSYEEACTNLVHMKDTIVTPNHEKQKYYEEQFAIFRELYGHNCRFVQKIAREYSENYSIRKLQYLKNPEYLKSKAEKYFR